MTGTSLEVARPAGPAVEASWYTAQDVLEAERTALFAGSWQLAASDDELPDPGCYATTTIAGMPVLVVRDTAGEVRAFHNVCRHRGIVLVEGAGRLGRFLTCPYHQWSYGLDGSLVRVPQADGQFEGVDLSCLGLAPVTCVTWHGHVFVRVSSSAAPFEEAWAGLDERLEHLVVGPLVQVARADYTAACNWKFLIENHIDVYHLWYLHNKTLSGYDHNSYRWESFGRNWWSYEPRKDRSGAPKVPEALAWLPEEDRLSIGAHLLFPNLMIVNTGEYFATYDATPIAPGRTSITLRVRANAGADAEPLVRGIRAFMAEDIMACERLQAATLSPAFSVGAMARSHEEPIRRFHASWRATLAGV
jgi:choline monooxygenase